jgi:hypothetical protein
MKKIIVTGILLFVTSIIYSQNFSTTTILSDTAGREADWGDFDNDGDLDILLFYSEQSDSSGNKITRILENTANGFIVLDVGLPIVENSGTTRNGCAEWVDYDNDGFLDIFLIKGNAFSAQTKLYRNNGNKTFTNLNLSISNLVPNSINPSWSDYDNDGDSDLLFFGRSTDFSSTKTLKLYKNNLQSGTFDDTGINFGNLFLKSNKPWADFNNDGYLDFLALKPSNNVQSNIAILKNNGNGTFTEIVYSDLLGLSQDDLNQSGDMVWGDYDHDGYADILISGQHTGSSGIGITYLYRNNGNETFTQIPIPNVYGLDHDVSIQWGDLDSDGDLDILLTGEGWQNNVDGTRIFINENKSFIDLGKNFLYAIQGGMSRVADYNNDGNLDFLVLGEFNRSSSEDVVNLYTYSSQLSNSAPTTPTNLKATYANNEIVFSWDKSTDNETISTGLTYNISIQRDGIPVVAANSYENGFRKIVGPGNACQNLFYRLAHPEDGTYTWKVQAIDNSSKGSSFAEVQTFQNSLGIKKYKMNLFKIYPDPAKNLINLESNVLTNLDQLFIYDVTGKLVFRKSEINLPYQIDVSNLESGYYTFKFQSTGETYYSKFIKN